MHLLKTRIFWTEKENLEIIGLKLGGVHRSLLFPDLKVLLVMDLVGMNRSRVFLALLGFFLALDKEKKVTRTTQLFD